MEQNRDMQPQASVRNTLKVHPKVTRNRGFGRNGIAE